MNENYQEALQLAGLREREAVVYFDLLQYGESQTGKICKRTKIPSSHIYTILEGLLDKGIISYRTTNNIKTFRASEPDTVAHLFEEREKKHQEEKTALLHFISRLKVLPTKADRLSDFRYYQGIRGIKSLYTEIINSWKEGDDYYIASAPMESFKRLEPFFLEIVHKKRIKDKVRLKMIINKNSDKWGMIRRKMPYTEVRYLDVNTTTEYGILNDYLFLITYSAEPYGLLIKDHSFAETYKVFFELLWRDAKI